MTLSERASAHPLRPAELGGLLGSGLIILAGFLYLDSLNSYRVITSIGFTVHTALTSHVSLVFPLLFLLLQPVLSLAIMRGAPGADPIILPAASFLAGLGVLFSARLSPAWGATQARYVLLGEGLLVLLVLFMPRIDSLRRRKYTLAALGLLGIVAMLLLSLRGRQYQPAELVTIPLVIFFAAFLDEKYEIVSRARMHIGPLVLPGFQYLAPMLIPTGAVTFLLAVVEHDLGSAFLFLGTFLAMVYAGTGRRAYPLFGVATAAVVTFAAYRVEDHVRVRFLIWLHPEQYHDAALQLWQGWIALASGGVAGQGLGQGYPYWIPVVANDSILAGIGEELGLVGVIVILSLLLLIVYRGVRIALWAENRFHKLLALGLAASLGVQTLVIAGGTLRLMPLTGVPLPFVSTGGFSVIAGFVAVALLLRISSESRGEWQ
jgi:cell division protein FtsW (lipid II flippase)